MTARKVLRSSHSTYEFNTEDLCIHAVSLPGFTVINLKFVIVAESVDNAKEILAHYFDDEHSDLENQAREIYDLKLLWDLFKLKLMKDLAKLGHKLFKICDTGPSSNPPGVTYAKINYLYEEMLC